MGQNGSERFKPINTFYVHFVYTLDYYFFLANFPSTFDPLSMKYISTRYQNGSDFYSLLKAAEKTPGLYFSYDVNIMLRTVFSPYL
ncbi:hypothetical protein Hdeb2414_s0005g00185201 [Helianthus debilis subsp. tardiflorus]